MNIDEIEKRAAALPTINAADDIWRNDSGGHEIRILRSARDANKVLAQLHAPSVELLVFLVHARQDVLSLVSALREAIASREAAKATLLKEIDEHTAAMRSAAELAKSALEEQAAAYEAQSKERQAEFEAADAALRESVEAAKNEHEAHVAELLSEHTAIVEKMKAEHTAIVEKMKAEHVAERDADGRIYAESFAALKREHAAKINECEEAAALKSVLHAQDVDDLKSAHAKTVAALEQRVVDLERSLAARDPIPLVGPDPIPSDGEEDADPIPGDGEEDE